MPVRGMRSSVDPAALGPGYWQLLDNIRFNRQSLQTRLGCQQLTSGVVTSGASYRGHWLGRLNGNEVLVVAYRIGSFTRLYKVNLTTFAFTEISLTSKFTNDGDVCFASVREPGFGDGATVGLDFLYISNGTAERPLIWTDGSTDVGPLEEFDVSVVNSGSYRPIPCGFFEMRDAANTSYPSGNGSGAFVYNDTGGTTANEVSFTITAAATLTTTATILFTGSDCCTNYGPGVNLDPTLDFSRSEQLWLILYDNVVDPITNYMDISLGVSSPVQVFSAMGATRIDPVFVPIGGGYYLVGIRLDSAILASLNAVDGIKFKLVKSFSATRTFKLAGIMAGGRVFNGADYTLAYADSGTRNESAGIVPVAQRTGNLTDYGCPLTLPYNLPQSDSLLYQYQIDFGGVYPAGADALMIYRQELGDPQPLLALSGLFTDPIVYDNMRTTDRVIFRPAPSAAGVAPKSGRCALGANNRLYIGGVFGGKGQVWISDDGFPWRFRPLPTDEDGDGLPDPTSGLVNSLSGEDVYGLLSMPGSFVGIAPVVVFTNMATWRMEGIDTASLARPTKMSAHGTIFPRTIVEFRGAVCYLDSDLIVRRLGGGIDDPPLSLYKVDDQLESGDMTKAAAFIYKERYGLAHRAPAASLNQRILVFEIMANEWCRDTYTITTQNWVGFATQGTGTTRRLLGFTEEGRIYQLEKPGQTMDDGSVIPITLKTPELHLDLWTECFWGRFGIVCDKATGVTLSTTRTDPLNSSNPGILTGTINVGSPATNRAYRWDGNGSDLVPPGMDAPSCSYQLTGYYPPGKFIKALVYEFDTYGVDRADVG